MPPTKLQRWLDVIAYLVARRFPVTVEQLMEGVASYAEKWSTADETARESARRMFERDKDEMRAAGIPIRSLEFSSYEHGPTVGYRLDRRDFYLPYLRLLQGEGEREGEGTEKGG